MDSHCRQQFSADHLCDTLKQQRILRMTRFIANVLECLPFSKRALVIRRIHRIQDSYKRGSKRFPGKQTKLSIQLLRLEHIRLKPQLYEGQDIKRYVPLSYCDAFLTYLTTIPITNRELFLHHISCIISNVIITNSGLDISKYRS